MGPAAIDFEYPYLIAALRNVPDPLYFAALSHHLYVDRRGAPENTQGGFSSLEKFALARAIARWSSYCEDRLIISEVNWPLAGTGVYSPVGSPYESPGPRLGDPSVDEQTYADYMIRYLLIALCSGFVDRVYWWRLVARGFGLVDDGDPVRLRPRPAYESLQAFLRLVGDAVFVEKMAWPGGRGESQGHGFLFRRRNGERTCILYATGGEIETENPFGFSEVRDAAGRVVAAREGRIPVGVSPLYARGVT